MRLNLPQSSQLILRRLCLPPILLNGRAASTSCCPNIDQQTQQLITDLADGSRAALARAITLVESRNMIKRQQGDRVLSAMMQTARQKCEKHGPEDSLIFRIGISGAPGVGKSTFIETFGMKLVEEMNKKLAVLCIDPSAHTVAGKLQSKGPIERNYGGSILGDMARMLNLSRHPRAFIRQSPTSGALGGVARGTHESVVLCEGAGYDLVFIETVGVGQSEVSVCDMVDMFILLLSPVHGDELQGVKRGIMEMCDLLVVTKADGQLASKAKITQAEFMSALKYLQPKSEHWKPQVVRASSVTGEGLDEIWDIMQSYWHQNAQTGQLKRTRDRQLKVWLWTHVQDELMKTFAHHPNVAVKTEEISAEIEQGILTPGAGAEKLLRLFFEKPL